MASKGATAALFDSSLKRLQAAMERVGARIGISVVPIPTHNRDADLLIAQQVDALATWTERLEKRFQAPEFETADAIDSILVPEDTAYILSGLAEVLVQDAGLEWETVDFTAAAKTDPLTHIKDQLVSAMRAKDLIPETEGEVVTKYVDTEGNPTDADGNPLPVDPNPDDGDRDTEDSDPPPDENAPAPKSKRPKPPSTRKGES